MPRRTARRSAIHALAAAAGALLLGGAAVGQVGPPPGPQPTPVRVGVHLLDVPRILEVDNTFDLEGYLTLEWRDPRLAFVPRPGEPSSRVHAGADARRRLAEIWSPDVIAVNAIGSGDFQRLRLVIGRDGRVTYSASVSARFKDDFDFRAFPFDRQRLSVVLQSYAWAADRVALELDAERTGPSPGLELPEWELLGLDGSASLATDPRDGRLYSRLAIEIELARRAAYYLWKVILPLLLLVTLSWTVFWMSEESLARRTGVTMTTLLTVVAYQFIVSESLPHLAYLTHLDALMLLSFACIALTALVNWAVATGPPGAPRAGIDHACRWLFPVGYAIGLAAIFGLRAGAAG